MARLETEFKPQPKNFDIAFEQFVAKQQQLKMDGVFEPFSVKRRKQLRTAVKESDWFKELYAEAINSSLVPISDKDFKSLEKDFAGAVWESIAYHFLSAQQPDNRVVLSPKQTAELFSLMLREKNENHQIIPNPFKMIGIKSHGLPDGIIYDLETQRSLFICEYTCSGSRKKFSMKIKNFKLGKKYNPRFYANTQLLFAVPNNNKYLERFSRNAESKLEIVPVPFTYNQFGEFTRGIIAEYRTNGVTLLEIQQLVRQGLMKTKITTDPSELFNMDVRSVESRGGTAIKV